MTTDPPPITIEFTPRLVKDLKRLSKKYPSVVDDLESLIERLENGETPGTRIQGVEHIVLKARLKSSDLAKGKSGGYG